MLAGGETVQLLRHTGWMVNEHRQKIPTFADPVDIPETGVDAPAVSEPRDETTRNVQWDYQLFLPPGTTVSDLDRVIVRGHECEVEQAGEALTNMFTGRLFRTEVLVRRVTR